ncbi:MAG TPA: 2-amino-4-hydroxy-6-hydroxymethyldihydropteridine diphosphokinase [Ignavibacteriaceae bacterium]|nr:2-amino-4-hydroxy-6-hydroxymethyldihydropteridine diphosphokinase [Ignavibacteriaceae bacterium]
MHSVYLGIGSNLGDKFENFRKAAALINDDGKCRITKASSIYETKPFGFESNSNFLNAVIKIETEYSVLELFRFLKSIEWKMGRKKSEKWDSRQIDLDILFYNDLIYSDENITVPHKGITSRDFVIIPLKELEPDLIHPELKEKIADIRTGHLKKNIITKVPGNFI